MAETNALCCFLCTASARPRFESALTAVDRDHSSCLPAANVCQELSQHTTHRQAAERALLHAGTNRITLFTPDGVLLPHTQDPVQSCTQLGEPCCAAIWLQCLLKAEQGQCRSVQACLPALHLPACLWLSISPSTTAGHPCYTVQWHRSDSQAHRTAARPADQAKHRCFDLRQQHCTCTSFLPVAETVPRCAANGTWRLVMNGFTFDTALPPHGSLASEPDFNIFAPGNLIAIEMDGRGGLKMRNNHGVTCV